MNNLENFYDSDITIESDIENDENKQHVNINNLLNNDL